MEKMIVVCTTFRDFRGTDNDKIQLLFLESLKRQTYKNWICAVTLFGEKNVVPTLERAGVPFVASDGDARGHRFSTTEVLLSGIRLAARYPDPIIMWTTCDVILDDHFFAEVVRRTQPSTCGTTYPHVDYRTIDDLRHTKNGRYFWEGGDLFFFSGDVFRDSRVREALKTYRNDGWGATEYYLQALGLAFCTHCINIWPTKLAKIENDRTLTDETRSFLTATNNVNGAIVRDLAGRCHLSPNMLHWISRFRTLSPMWFVIWFQSRFRLHILGIRYHLRKMLP